MPDLFSNYAADLEGLDHLFDSEDLGHLLFKNKVTARNHLGRFATEVSDAHRRATISAGRSGADFMRRIVPKKTGRFASTIHWHVTTNRSGEITWGKGADYWRYVAFGAKPHEIKGWVRFFWEREGRLWEPGPNIIKHPGTKSHPFIQETVRYTEMQLEESMRREYAAIR